MWVRAAALAVAACVAILALIGTFDALYRPRAAWLRWLISGSGWVAVIVVLGVILQRALRSRFDPVSVARRIERASPSLGDRLSGAIALLATPGGGSAQESAFRQSAVRRVESLMAAVPPQPSLSLRPTGVALLAAVAVTVAVGIVAANFETHARIAAARLVPWSDARYPVRDDLRIEQLKQTVAAGSDLQFLVRDEAGELPGDLRIEIRPLEAGQGQARRLASDISAVGDAVAQVQIRDVQHSLQLRAVGGDSYDTPWHKVRVVTGASVVRSTFTVAPPEYTGRPRQEIEATKIAAPEGSRVELRVSLNQQIDAHSLRYMALDDGGSQPPQVEVVAEGRAITAVVESLAAAHRWRFGWQTVEGARGESDFAWEIGLIPDTLPETRWIEPASGPVTVSPEARLDARFLTVDDYGLTEISVAAIRSTGKPLPVAVQPSFSIAGGDAAPERWEATVAVRLSDYGLQAGEQVDMIVTATDTAGETASSQALHVIVVAAEVIREQADRIRQSAADALQSAIREHRIAEQELRRASEALLTDRDPEAADAAVRHGISSQRSSQLRTADGPGAAADRLRESAELLRANQAGDPEPDAALSRALAELAQGDMEELLSQIQQVAENLPESASDVDESLRQQFDEVASRQQSTREALQGALDRLMKEDRRRQILDSISDLAEDQSRIRAETAASSSEGDRRSAAQSQRDMARRVQQLIEDLEQLAREDQAGTAEQRAAAAAAAKQLQDARVRQNMQQAADLVQRGNVGRATAIQEEIQRALDNAARTTESTNPAIAAENHRRALLQLDERLQQAASQQDELLQAEQAAAGVTPEEASGLAEELESLGAEARELELSEAAENIERASQRDRSAAEELSASSPDREAVGQQLQEAREALQQAQDALDDALGAAEQQSQQAAASNIARSAARLAEQQRAIVAQIESAETREERLEISRQERSLSADVSRLSDEAGGLLGFEEVIRYTVGDMLEAATALVREETQLALQHAEAAARQLEAIAEAARWAAQPQGSAPPQETAGEESPPQQAEGASPPESMSIAGIRLLRNLQQQLLEETAAVDSGANDPAIDREVLEQRKADLTERQRRLMEMTRRAIESLQQEQSQGANAVDEVEI